MQDFSQIQFPVTLSGLFSEWQKTPDAKIYMHGAYWMQNQRKRLLGLPARLLSADRIDELHNITRTERFLEIGTSGNLNRILVLGKTLPAALRLSIRATSTCLLRNVLTIGSCVFKKINEEYRSHEPVMAALVALKAQYEIRFVRGSRRVSAWQFLNMDRAERKDILSKGFVTKIFIPLENWDDTICCDFSSKGNPENGTEYGVFLLRSKNGILKDIRAAFSGMSVLNSRKIEESIINNRLPFEKKVIQAFLKLWKNYLETIKDRSAFQKAKVLNFLESALFTYAR